MPLILILLLAILQCFIINYLVMNPDHYQLGSYSWESNDFRVMRLEDAAVGLNSLDTDVVTTLVVEHDYDLTGLKDTRYNNRLPAATRPASYRKLKHAYGTALGDSRYFPIPKSQNEDVPEVVLEDDWMGERGYASGGGDGGGREDGQVESDQEGGGQADDNQKDSGRQNSPKRRREGCNIMGTKMPPGYYPVVSVTDGVIEKIGWLEIGGWHIDVRAPGGTYLHYAYLYDYAGDLEEGDRTKAGKLVGCTGDIGYGKTEGTRGNFDVHFHVGIYIKTDHNEEMSMDPYWALK